MSVNSQIPLQYQIFDSRTGVMTQPWAFWFTQFVANLPPGGTGYVVNGVQSTLGQVTLYIGLDAAKGLSANGDIYFATDTSKIYVGVGSVWETMIPHFTGDVSNPAAGSTTLTLATVNSAVGTFGSSTDFPVITVDSKGRITNVTLQPVSSGGGGLPSGGPGSVQFTNGISFASSPTFRYDGATLKLIVTNELINGQITFANPIPTRTNLLPVQTGKAGMVLATNGTDVFWESPGPYEFVFHYGDATPSPLMTIPAGKAVLSCQVVVLQAMNGTGAALSVGSTASTYTDVMNITDNLPSSLSTWSVEPNTVFGVNTGIFLSITPGAGATAGAGIVTITVQQ